MTLKFRVKNNQTQLVHVALVQTMPLLLSSSAALLLLPWGLLCRPTVEQWSDPLRYISSIRPQAEIYGICKIIPPEGWAPPLALDKNSFRFSTVIQAVHRLQDRLSLPAQQAFLEELRGVMNQEGKAPKKPPSFGGREVDLYKMYRAVAKRGGYAAVTEEKKWKDVVRVLQVGQKASSRHCMCSRVLWYGSASS